MYYEGAEGLRIKAVTFSPDERQIYAIGDNWTLYRFPVACRSAGLLACPEERSSR